MSNDMNSWPPALKEWVTACFAKMTDANRAEAQAELKEVIADAYGKKKLWEIDWKSVELASLSATKPTPLKRKLNDTPKKSSKKFQISEEQAAKAKRARRFEREHELERQRNNGVSTSLVGINGISSSASLSSRLGPRFMGAQEDVEDITMADPNVIDWDRYTIVGCSTSLFKNYLRLTSEPDPKDIRPLHILVETLAELKRRWKRDNDYPWICDQFKSLRQDLTVQRIKTEFTVQVYEIHARMALENADLVEYNQCQATLRQLYELGIPGKNDEFTAYRILYMIHARNRAELNFLVGRLTDEQKAVPAIRHALDVQTALATSNYHAFFALFLKAPNMGGYIMDHFVERERVRALMVMCKAYVTGVPLSFIATELALDSATQVHELLAKHNASFYIDASLPDQDKIFNGKMAFQALFDSYHTKFRKVGIRGSI